MPENQIVARLNYRDTSMYKFACTLNPKGFPFQAAVKEDPAERWVLRAILDKPDESDCWPYAILTLGVLGNEKDAMFLRDYMTEPQIDRLGDFTGRHSPVHRYYQAGRYSGRALGLIAGKSVNKPSNTTDEIVGHLIACSKDGYWDRASLEFSYLSKTVFTRDMMIGCIKGLSYTRSDDALLFLSEYEKDESVPIDIRYQAQQARNVFDVVFKSVQ